MHPRGRNQSHMCHTLLGSPLGQPPGTPMHRAARPLLRRAHSAGCRAEMPEPHVPCRGALLQ
eukprot:9664154-Alexandrium_andersonii.AAC.1